MKFILILASLLGSSYSFHGNHPPWVASRREVANNAATICQSVRELLDRARAGITANDLGSAAGGIQAAADAFLDANGGEVPTEDVQALINKTAAQFNGQATVDALFADPLQYSADLIKTALTLLDGLCDHVDGLGEGESPNPAIAAISMTAEATENTVENTVAFVTYMAENQGSEKSKPAKRWEFTGGYQHNPFGNSWNIGISHSWRRGVSSVVSVQKRQKWNGGLTGGYSKGKGLHLGGEVGYKGSNGWAGKATGGYSQSQGWNVGGEFGYKGKNGLSAGVQAGHSQHGGTYVGLGLKYTFGRR